jgi:hypothetical protein
MRPFKVVVSETIEGTVGELTREGDRAVGGWA